MSQLKKGGESKQNKTNKNIKKKLILKNSIPIALSHKAMWSVGSCLAPQAPVRQPS